MVEFIDGPAQGETLVLRNSPVMLRVVRSSRGNWDALDYPDDEPRPQERVFVYRLVGQPGRYHVKATKKSESGFCADAKYTYHYPPPSDDYEVRTKDGWDRWCRANRNKIHELYAASCDKENVRKQLGVE